VTPLLLCTGFTSIDKTALRVGKLNGQKGADMHELMLHPCLHATSCAGRITNYGPQVPAGYSSFILTLYNNVVKTLVVPNQFLPSSMKIGEMLAAH
jgi:hypothetical protein